MRDNRSSMPPSEDANAVTKHATCGSLRRSPALGPFRIWERPGLEAFVFGDGQRTAAVVAQAGRFTLIDMQNWAAELLSKCEAGMQRQLASPGEVNAFILRHELKPDGGDFWVVTMLGVAPSNEQLAVDALMGSTPTLADGTPYHLQLNALSGSDYFLVHVWSRRNGAQMGVIRRDELDQLGELAERVMSIDDVMLFSNLLFHRTALAQAGAEGDPWRMLAAFGAFIQQWRLLPEAVKNGTRWFEPAPRMSSRVTSPDRYEPEMNPTYAELGPAPGCFAQDQTSLHVE